MMYFMWVISSKDSKLVLSYASSLSISFILNVLLLIFLKQPPVRAFFEIRPVGRRGTYCLSDRQCTV